jgi:hypothetical protein
MIFTKCESQYGAPAGVYPVTFLGVDAMRDDGKPRIGRDGKPMAPGIEWRFSITTGPYAGRLVTRITSTTPTARNACGALLDGILGRPAAFGETADIAAFIGKPYRVVVGPSQTNPQRTQVVQVLPSDVTQAPPAAPTAGVAARPSDAEAVWVAWGAESGRPSGKLTRAQAQADFTKLALGTDADRAQLAKVKVKKGDLSGMWVAPVEMGFDVSLPF